MAKKKKYSKLSVDSTSKPKKITSTRTKCCKGGKHEFIPVVFGKPTSSGFEKAEKGLIILAGCLLPVGKIPHMKCKNCSYTIYRTKKEFMNNK